MLKESFKVTNERIEESWKERTQIIDQRVKESWEERDQVIEESIEKIDERAIEEQRRCLKLITQN